MGLCLFLANVVGGVVEFGYGQLAFSGPTTNCASCRVPPPFLRDIPLFITYVSLTSLAVAMYSAWSYTRSVAWLQEGRAPTDRERDALLRQPWRLTLAAFFGWLGAAVLFGVGGVAFYGRPVSHGLRLGLDIVVAGLTTAALAHLLAERAFRPLFAIALVGAPSDRATTFTIRRRLLRAWALGSGIPLAGVALVPIAAEGGNDARVILLMALLALIGLTAGLATTAAAAESVASPLQSVRVGMSHVEAGTLDAQVVVDDAGEVGLLQSGFNAMAAGLRERQALQDLFGRHVGVEVARRALAGGVGIGGEQRDVTVLFVDMIGSTALAEERPAADVLLVLNAYFAAVVEAAGAEGGWVNKFEGDGALCVFGAPGDQPDHAVRALRSARALRGALDALAARHPGLDAGIGVSSGIVAAGNVGAEERYEYTVIGDPVNEAARLTERAKLEQGRVLVAGSTLARARSEADAWRDAGLVELRGRLRPTRIFVPAESPVAAPA
jgi:adenylate cyclase